jgi:hypothetical protein
MVATIEGPRANKIIVTNCPKIDERFIGVRNLLGKIIENPAMRTIKSGIEG